MKVARTRVFDAVRGGARPVPAGEELPAWSGAGGDDGGESLHRLERGEIAPYQKTWVVKSRVTAPAEVAED